MQHKLATWAESDPSRRFDRLLRLIADRDWLAEAARIVLASSGARTPGIDGMDKRRLQGELDQHLVDLRADLLKGAYRPKPVKRVYIPKANGKLRPLGIPHCCNNAIGGSLNPFAWKPSAVEQLI
jgi:retron-type reverse transcriptase